METEFFTLSEDEALDLTTDLPMDDDQIYEVQNDGNSDLYVVVAAAEPTNFARGRIVSPKGVVFLTKIVGYSHWLFGRTGIVVNWG